jgi:FxsC-like protein
MAYAFFFSYARSNNDAYLQQMFADLNDDIRQKSGLANGVDAGFFDQRGIELGDDWDATLVEALQSSRVFVAAASPGYFNSEYCGKEWALFRLRCQAAAGGKALPPLLKPIVWIAPLPVDGLPDDVKVGQLTMDDPQALQNTKGFRYLLKQLQAQRTLYNDLIYQLGDEIIEAGRQHPVAPLAQVPALAAVPAAFPRAAAAPLAGAARPAPAAASGPRHVHFVYLAADPNEFGAARPPEPYVDAGAGDWKPFFPDDTTRVHRLMQRRAAEDDLDFTSSELPLGADLIMRIEQAWQQRQLVVLVIDGWSLHWDAQRPQPVYQDLLRQLDGRFDYHWCVLVPWNEGDAPSTQQRDDICATVRNTFDRHATLAPNPMYFRDGIRSPGELKQSLAEVLTRLKEEIKKRAPVQRAVPTGPARPVVIGPSART